MSGETVWGSRSALREAESRSSLTMGTEGLQYKNQSDHSSTYHPESSSSLKPLLSQATPLAEAVTPLLQAMFYGVLLLVSHVTHSHIIKLNTPFCTSSPLTS